MSIPPKNPVSSDDETQTKIPRCKTLFFLWDDTDPTNPPRAYANWYGTRSAAERERSSRAKAQKKNKQIIRGCDLQVIPVDIPTDKKLLAYWLEYRGVVIHPAISSPDET